MSTSEQSRADAMAEGCSARYMGGGSRVTVRKLWKDDMGRDCITWDTYAYGVRSEPSGWAGDLTHDPRCASAFCPRLKG